MRIPTALAKLGDERALPALFKLAFMGIRNMPFSTCLIISDKSEVKERLVEGLHAQLSCTSIQRRKATSDC